MSNTEVDWRELRVELDGKVLAEPCIAVRFHLGFTDTQAVLDFQERALALIEPMLEYYEANGGKTSKYASKARSLLPSWFERPKKQSGYFFDAYGGGDKFYGPARITVAINFWPMPKTEEEEIEAREMMRKIHAHSKIGILRWGQVTLTLPVDHPSAHPSVLLPWIHELQFLKAGSFTSGFCSYQVARNQQFEDVAKLQEALCLRYPGLGWWENTAVLYTKRWEEALNDELELILRAEWLTILNLRSTSFLGGEKSLRAAVESSPEIQVTVAPGATLIRAGGRPLLGDAALSNYLPLQQKVAKVLRPVRVEELPDNVSYLPEMANRWLNMFDREEE